MKYQSPEIALRAFLQLFIGTVLSDGSGVGNRDLVFEAAGLTSVFDAVQLEQTDAEEHNPDLARMMSTMATMSRAHLVLSFLSP